MEPLVSGTLIIAPSESEQGPESDTVILYWHGRSTARQPSRDVVSYVVVALERALYLTTSVRLHFEHLEYMNSSTVTAIIQIVREAHARNVPLRLVYNSSKAWQRLAFEALRIFVKGDGLFEIFPV